MRRPWLPEVSSGPACKRNHEWDRHLGCEGRFSTTDPEKRHCLRCGKHIAYGIESVEERAHRISKNSKNFP